MNADEKWKALQTWIKGYILFDKIDRQSGNEILMLMDEIDTGNDFSGLAAKFGRSVKSFMSKDMKSRINGERG